MIIGHAEHVMEGHSRVWTILLIIEWSDTYGDPRLDTWLRSFQLGRPL